MLLIILSTSLLAIASVFMRVDSAPVKSDIETMDFLTRYGYFNDTPIVVKTTSLLSFPSNKLTAAIKKYQAFNGLKKTGILDDKTKRHMNQPRCGLPDIIGSKDKPQQFAVFSKWSTKQLTYRIIRYTNKLPEHEVDQIMARAFQVWSDVTDLTFTPRRSGKVHIQIKFVTADHDDGTSFDGPGGVLGHAFFPSNGNVCFDNAETWTINTYQGQDLFQVAAHEIGHVLGLMHSERQSALMYAYARPYDPNFRLDSDDVQGIQSLYGAKSATWRTPPPPTARPITTRPITTRPVTTRPITSRPFVPLPGPGGNGDVDFCSDSKFDTIFFNIRDGKTYVFKGDKYWQVTPEGLAPGYPQYIGNSWVGLPGNIDAAFSYLNGKTYFFKGAYYWRYDGMRMDGEYPKLISQGFQGIPDDIDTAFLWSGNNHIYFFKGHHFWLFDFTNLANPVSQDYPKPISHWGGLPPGHLDAALQYTDGHTYFFKDGFYYRFNDKAFAVDLVYPPYPRYAGDMWFGCRLRSRISAAVDAPKQLAHQVSPKPANLAQTKTKKRPKRAEKLAKTTGDKPNKQDIKQCKKENKLKTGPKRKCGPQGKKKPLM